MQKEKKIRTYTRKTKTGKTVTVKAHTAKYDAAEEARKAFAAKRGAGEEVTQRKLDAEWQKIEDAFMEEHPDFEAFDNDGFETKENRALAKKMLAFSKKHPEWKNGIASGKSKAPKVPKTPQASKGSDLGFTEADYKAWYHWDTEADPKNESALKVKKALIAKMGRSAYNKYEKQMTDSYSARGHLKGFKGLGDLKSQEQTSKEKLQMKQVKEKRAREERGAKTDSSGYISKDKFMAMSDKQQDNYFDKVVRNKEYTTRDGTPLGPRARIRAMQEEAKKFRKFYGISSDGTFKKSAPKEEAATATNESSLNFDKKFKRDSPETTLSKNELSSLRSDYGFSGIKKTADGKYSYVENDTGEKKVATVKQIRKMIAPFENAKGLSVMSASEYKQRSKKNPSNNGSGMITSDGVKLHKKKAGKGVFLVGTDGRAYREITKKDGTTSYKYSAEDTKYVKTDGGRKPLTKKPSLTKAPKKGSSKKA